jgi:V-type H+-transporting ATPase subunit a
MFCVKEKSIYATLNLFEGGQRTPLLKADCWFPAAEETFISSLLMWHSSSQRDTSHALILPHRNQRAQPPTYIKRNALTAPFQELIDTYGLPRYQEVNPMVFAVVTFPFLFGIMYGDVGHGLMLFAVGLWAVWNAESIRFTVPMLYFARYMLAMMGFFSIYAGLLYNDFFSLGFNWFGSRYEHSHAGGELTPIFDTKNAGGAGPYPFGLDPAWHGASNELLYLNSLKMKTSVIIGVAQMALGLCLRFLNAGHERSVLDFCFECIPMMIFLVAFFGYMDFMIMYKWVTHMDNPPSIINSLICMAMFQEDKYPMFDAQLPRYLMIAAVLTVPILLLPKPICLYIQNRSSGSAAQTNVNGGGGGNGGQDEEAGLLSGNGRKKESESHGHGHGEEFNFGEIMIHQIIETIEYVLGTVSHTASYLRLWALSLAHQQLSLVFFQKTIGAALVMSFPWNGFAITGAYAFWFAITVGVLLGMDVMECFLHVLRLHWVEFQSKFYRADGYAFKPYRHRELLIQE